jgi:hypothetical protein
LQNSDIEKSNKKGRRKFKISINKEKHLYIHKSLACLLSPKIKKLLSSNIHKLNIQITNDAISSSAIKDSLLGLLSGKPILIHKINFSVFQQIFSFLENSDFQHFFGKNQPKHQKQFYLSINSLKHVSKNHFGESVHLPFSLEGFSIPKYLIHLFWKEKINFSHISLLNKFPHYKVVECTQILNRMKKGHFEHINPANVDFFRYIQIHQKLLDDILQINQTLIPIPHTPQFINALKCSDEQYQQKITLSPSQNLSLSSNYSQHSKSTSSTPSAFFDDAEPPFHQKSSSKAPNLTLLKEPHKNDQTLNSPSSASIYNNSFSELQSQIVNLQQILEAKQQERDQIEKELNNAIKDKELCIRNLIFQLNECRTQINILSSDQHIIELKSENERLQIELANQHQQMRDQFENEKLEFTQSKQNILQSFKNQIIEKDNLIFHFMSQLCQLKQNQRNPEVEQERSQIENEKIQEEYITISNQPEQMKQQIENEKSELIQSQ